MIYLHKLIPLLFSPIAIALILMGYGTWTRRRWPGFLGIAVLYLASINVISNPVVRYVENHAVKQQVANMPGAEAIVVLGGILKDVEAENGFVSEWRDGDRYFDGLALYKAGKAAQLIFTGGMLPWSVSQETEGSQLKQFAVASGIPETAIRVSGAVYNTRDEARAVRAMFDGGAPHIILVTSAFHMPRAQMLFEREGFQVSPYPVDFKVDSEKITPMDFLPDAAALFRTDLVCREMIGRLYYRFISMN